MSNLVGHTNSYIDPDGTPPHPPEIFDNEWLPQPSSASVQAADAASCCHEHPHLVKRPLGVCPHRMHLLTGAGPINIREWQRLERTSAASAPLLLPAAQATAPVPRPDSLADVPARDVWSMHQHDCSSQPSILCQECPPNDEHCCLFLAMCWAAT